MRRLAELERGVRPGPTPDRVETFAEPDEAFAEPDQPFAEPDQPFAKRDEQSADDAVAPRASGSSDPRLRRLWVASLGAAVIVTAVITALATARLAAPEPLVDGVHHVESLAVDEDFAWPAMFGESETQGFVSLGGLTAFTQTYADDAPCLFVYETEKIDPDSNSYAGQGFIGCGAGRFPASVALVVDEMFAPSVQAEFGEGTSLQFVLTGDTVEVYSDRP